MKRGLIKTLLRRLDGERGSAMTEFVIGLPVFILIFAGMGSIYRLNEEALKAKAEVNAKLWEAADPGSGAIIPVFALGNVGNFEDLANNGASVLGIYADSYVKSFVPLLLPGSRPSSGCFTLECGQIGMSDEMFSKKLLDDNVLNSGGLSADGWASVLSSALTVTGSRPAFAAGIRYGAVDSASVSRSVSTPMWGDYSFETGDLQLPGVTDPTHRILAVALTRVEFATNDVFNEQIPEFDENFDFGSSSVSAGECTSAVQETENCQMNPPTNPLTGQPDPDLCPSPGDACESLAGDNPLADLTGGFCTPGTPGC